LQKLAFVITHDMVRVVCFKRLTLPHRADIDFK
jgi:hypothetical protein